MKPGFGEYLQKFVIGIGKHIPEIEIVKVDTDKDHIHILVGIPPKMSVSEVVKAIKAKTGLYIRKKFPFLDKVYPGYFPHSYGLHCTYSEQQRRSSVFA